jgi:hypothetical protein
MTDYMPLAHDARRLFRGHLAGNPFVTERELAEHLDRMTAAYLATTSAVTARALKVEIDHIETLV